MNTSTAHDRLLSPDLHITRRGIAAVTLAGTLAAGGAVELGKLGVGAGNKIASNVHQANEYPKFDHELGNTFNSASVKQGLKAEGVSPADVTLHTINVTEANPTEAALDMGAKDPTLVASEISGQVGGDKSMQVGEIVAVPNDQLQAGK